MKPMIMPEPTKDKTKKWLDHKISRKEFKVEELVLLYNSKKKLFPRKLKSRWSGPYTVVAITPFGAVTLKKIMEMNSK